MKIQEKRTNRQGFKGPRTQTKVSTLPDGQPMPDGAVSVPDETPEHDWQDEEASSK